MSCMFCSRQCPNGDGIYTLLYALYKYSTSITNQPKMSCNVMGCRTLPYNTSQELCTGFMFCCGLVLVNSLRPRQNGRPFPDDIFNSIFLNENVWTPIKISLKFVPKCLINNIPALDQIMAWCRPGDKPLSEPMMVTLLTHICVTRPQWVNSLAHEKCFGPWEKFSH